MGISSVFFPCVTAWILVDQVWDIAILALIVAFHKTVTNQRPSDVYNNRVQIDSDGRGTNRLVQVVVADLGVDVKGFHATGRVPWGRLWYRIGFQI